MALTFARFTGGMKVPSVRDAHAILAEGERLTPGPWADHCRTAGECARAIAACHPEMDAEVAYVMGLLHDVGRRAAGYGLPDAMHVVDGYRHLMELGYDDAARICLTHSFPIKDAGAFAAPWGDLHDERRFVQDHLDGVEYTPYDRLIQLCDSIALPAGPVLMEKRFVDVALRHGFNALTLDKWRAFMQIKREFDAVTGGSIYRVLPGVVENTFGEISLGEP